MNTAPSRLPLCLLLLLAFGLVLGCAPADDEERFREIAGSRLLMISVLDPAADLIWDAVRTEMTLEGVFDFEPQNEEEWAVVRNHAVVLAESGNLLMIGSRRRPGTWDAWSRDLIAAGEAAMRAAEAQDSEKLFEIGGEIYRSCAGCHAEYWRPDFVPEEGSAFSDASGGVSASELPDASPTSNEE